MVYRIIMYVIHVRGLWIDTRQEEFSGEVAQEILMCCVDRGRGRQLQDVNHRSVGTAAIRYVGWLVCCFWA